VAGKSSKKNLRPERTPDCRSGASEDRRIYFGNRIIRLSAESRYTRFATSLRDFSRARISFMACTSSLSLSRQESCLRKTKSPGDRYGMRMPSASTHRNYGRKSSPASPMWPIIWLNFFQKVFKNFGADLFTAGFFRLFCGE
jgi:hypothetical protein